MKVVIEVLVGALIYLLAGAVAVGAVSAHTDGYLLDDEEGKVMAISIWPIFVLVYGLLWIESYVRQLFER